MQRQTWIQPDNGRAVIFLPHPILAAQANNRRKLYREKAWICACAVILLYGASLSSAQTYTVLADFDRSTGYALAAQTLLQGFDGNFYGTTIEGPKYLTAGTVFKLTGSGELTAIYDFCSQKGCPDGGNSDYGLTLGTDGNFYGAATAGGAYQQGTIFKLTPEGTMTTLYSFCESSGCPDGRYPLSVVLGVDGNFYGTTRHGGGHSDAGTVFKITPSGSLTKLYSFCSLNQCADGQLPNELLLGADGNFYGTTQARGSNDGGTIFKITRTGALTTLYNFCSQKVGTVCLDGNAPGGSLVQASDGNFYGITGAGGTNIYGTAFRVESTGALTTLYNFCSQSNCSDGASPDALIQATDGNLYGAAAGGGFSNGCCGTAFKLTLQGALTTLYVFCSEANCEDGDSPNGLQQGTDGSFYGTTALGGTFEGVAYQLSNGLGPFVKTVPGFGRVGSTITILGTNLGGTTGVKFHGVASTYTVVSDSEIQAIIPSGATTGKVEVMAPTGGLFSNVPFFVRQ